MHLPLQPLSFRTRIRAPGILPLSSSHIQVDDSSEAWWYGSVEASIGSRAGEFPGNYVERIKTVLLPNEMGRGLALPHLNSSLPF